MLLNLKKIIKNDRLKSEKKVKKYIRKTITDPDFGSMNFVKDFVEIANLKEWKWVNNEINVINVLDILIDYVYRIVKAEVKYYEEHKKWYTEGWLISGIGSGRLSVRPVDFEAHRHQIWLEIEFSTTL